MPANLDVATRRIVVFVSSFTTLAIAIPALYAQFVMIPNFRRKLSSSGITIEASNPSLFAGCLLSVALMVAVTIVATLPIIASDNEHRLQQQQFLSSSINFCEEDFQSSPYIAEPANTMSSLTCYVPLALFGLVSTRHGQRAKRFVVIYSTLLAIGLGSMALHALLTAQAQGGDELPMLWFTAAVAFCALDVIFHRYNKTMWLAVLVAGSAVIATATYIGGRHDFTIFYILFSVYCQTMVFSIIYITLGIDWESISLQHEGLHFKAAVLYPLAIATGWSTVLAVWIWVSEMLYCNAVMQDGAFGVVVAPFVWNRVVHPMWHFWSGMLAFLLIQVLVAAHGVQRGWGTPAIQWFGAPFVVFRQDLSQTKSQ